MDDPNQLPSIDLNLWIAREVRCGRREYSPSIITSYLYFMAGCGLRDCFHLAFGVWLASGICWHLAFQ